MKQVHVAAPVSALLVIFTFSLVSAQTPTKPRQAFVADMQTPAQVSTANASPEDRKLTDEETADLYMARKQYREASQTYFRLAQQNPKNAVYLNKLGIALHQQTDLREALKYYQRAVKADPQYAGLSKRPGKRVMSGARITAHSAMCDRSMAHAGVCVLFGGAIEGGDVRVGTRVAVDLARVIRSVS